MTTISPESISNNIHKFKQALETIPENKIPIIIPVFNLCSYVKNIVHQLTSRGITEFIICDNASTYPPMMKYLDELAETHRVVRFDANMGPHFCIQTPQILTMLPEYFVVTDPDLVFNINLPDNFIAEMQRVIHSHGVSKAGFALDIHKTAHKFFNKEQVHKWEGKYWTNKVTPSAMCISDDTYYAPVDTTFCLYKKSTYVKELMYLSRGTTATSAVRIAGRFTCEHMGWWKVQPVLKEEMDYYHATQKWCSTYNERMRLKI